MLPRCQEQNSHWRHLLLLETLGLVVSTQAYRWRQADSEIISHLPTQPFQQSHHPEFFYFIWIETSLFVASGGQFLGPFLE
jgi:hypothetical protein